MQAPVPRRPVLVALRTSGALPWLVVAIACIAVAHAVFYFVTEYVVLGRAKNPGDEAARLHDLGGFFLVCWHFVAGTAVLGTVYTVMRRGVPPRTLRRWLAARPTRVMIVSAAVTATVCAVLFGAVLRGQMAVEDDHTYLFQATLLSQGRVALPWAWEGFDHAFTWPWITNNGRRYSSFQMPGHCVFLALGVLAGVPWVVPVLAVVVLAVATHCAARHLYGRRTAVLTSLLLVASPYVLVTHSSYSAAASGAMAAALLVWAAAALLTRPTAWRGIALGGAWALLWFVRPPTAAIYALPIGIVLLRRCLRGRMPGPPMALSVATALAGMAPYFLYCHAVTGSWSLSPGGVYSDRLQSPEISLHNLLSHRGHVLMTGFPNALVSVVRLNCYLLGWPLSLFPIGVLLLRRRWRGTNGWLLAICGLLIGFYCLSEKILGWYYFEIVPCLLILSARGLIELRHWMAERSARPRQALDRVASLALAGSVAAITVAVPATMLRQSQFVKVWMAAPNWVEAHIPEPQALVFLDRTHTDSPTCRTLLATNDPDLANRIVYARTDGDAQREACVRSHFPQRTIYRYAREASTGAHSLERVASRAR